MQRHPHLCEPGPQPDRLPGVVLESLLDAVCDHDAVPPLLPARLGKDPPAKETVPVLAETVPGDVRPAVHSGLPASAGGHSISFRFGASNFGGSSKRGIGSSRARIPM